MWAGAPKSDAGERTVALDADTVTDMTAWRKEQDTEKQAAGVVREPGEQTELISLIPRGVCLYKAAFSPGTPDIVIIAAVEAALTRPAPARPGRDRAGHRPPAHPRRKPVTCDDDR